MIKKLLVMFIFIIYIFPFSAFGQEEDIFVKSVPIVKIFSHKLGYKIYYLKDDMKMAHFYAPIEWFTQAGGKGTIIWGRTDEYPYFSIFWMNKKFHHIKLFLRESVSHQSWGVLEATDATVKEKFIVEDLILEF